MKKVRKLQARVFPEIEGKGEDIDHYIVEAIDSSMNIVRDQLRQTCSTNLSKASDNQTRINHQGKLHVMDANNFKDYLDIVTTVIDFYKLFQKAAPNIIEIWESKLRHVQHLEKNLDIQHKSKFYEKIWKDDKIKAVIKAFNQAPDFPDLTNEDRKQIEDARQPKLKELKKIHQELEQAHQAIA